MRSISSKIVTTVVVLMSYSIIALSAISLDKQTLKYRYARDHLIGLDYLVQNVKRSNEIDELSKSNPTEAQMKILRNTRNSIKEMNHVIQLIEQYKGLGDDTMQESVIHSVSTYTMFKDLFSDMLTQLESLYGPDSSTDTINKVTLEGGRIGSDMDTAYELLLYQSIMVSHALTSQEPSAEGTMNRLGITSDERQELINTLDLIYGDSIKGGMSASQTHLTAAGAVLRQFLTQQWNTLDSR